VTDSNRDFFVHLSQELGNTELGQSLLREMKDEISVPNVTSRLLLGNRFNLDCSKEIEFIAACFHERSFPEIKELGCPILSQILSSPWLKIQSEDWLYAMIWTLIEYNSEYFELLEHIHFEFVSVEGMGSFIDNGAQYLDRLNPRIWASIGRRLVLPVAPETSNNRIPNREITFTPNFDAPMNGIISYLASKCNGNVHEKGIIKVAASSEYSLYPAKNVADLRNRGDTSCPRMSRVRGFVTTLETDDSHRLIIRLCRSRRI
jgi:hypothetical protein